MEPQPSARRLVSNVGAQGDGEKEEENQALHCQNGTALGGGANPLRQSASLKQVPHGQRRIVGRLRPSVGSAPIFYLLVVILSEIEGCLRDDGTTAKP